ncbi:helix-turn-helix domain-containing protein [Vagococcus silagei]|uniref:XRE family transcriptional regulator n=1 Tax=Vagococcus silagei TaxID=2508885 RepID=A0A4S3B6H4_9ENTE|nr:helix-turn-helix transcriptional regulator [Vagococcus silagei]THB61510.1 XRE family transcriptional regulator [Vagococcus silagei]
MSFGSRLKELRTSNNMTQEDLGKKINVSKVSISGYENGTRSPDRETLVCLANFFDVSLDYLVARVPEHSCLTPDDNIDLKKLLDSNLTVSYEGKVLTNSERQKIKNILIGVFW